MNINDEYIEKRRQYMSNEINHDDFYLWLAGRIGLSEENIPVSNEQIINSKDPYFNDIPLVLWDNKHDWVLNYYVRKSGLKAWSLCESVCCLKALARQKKEKLS